MAFAVIAALLSAQTTRPLTDYLVIDRVGSGGRSPIQTDEIEALMASGATISPKSGDQLTFPGGRTATWKSATAGKDGFVESSAWAYAEYKAPADGVVYLEATGQSTIYVNGVPLTTDPYGFGYSKVPVALKAGTNTILAKVSRGRLKVQFAPVTEELQLLPGDLLMPTPVVGEGDALLGAVVASNATGMTKKVQVVARTTSGVYTTADYELLPYSTRKLAFRFRPLNAAVGTKYPVNLQLKSGGVFFSSLKAEVTAVSPTQNCVRTRISNVDGSVQYYAVNPATNKGKNALVLSVHGASVEATGQAGAYGQKSWANIVCPTNRRPYGFDWEDWGRLDALEALADAKKHYQTELSKTYLVGHSMGGHGTWSLGSLFPDQFAAIAPAAGWINFWQYGGAIRLNTTGPVQSMLMKSSQVSDPLLVIRNYLQQGVFVLHGDADETVPIQQARDMRKKLAEFHTDVSFYEHPGGGHWYDATDMPGADCVDYPPMFQFLAKRSIPSPDEATNLEFWTTSPGISSKCQWVEVLQQESIGDPTSVKLEQSDAMGRVKGTTTNAASLKLNLSHWNFVGDATLAIDGQTLKVPISKLNKTVSLVKSRGAWIVQDLPKNEKNPQQYGYFKSAFNNRFVYVYGTCGTEAENQWAMNKTRQDQLVWWYRGNGDFDAVADKDFRPEKFKDRSVILIGNEDMNCAWPLLLKDRPISIKRGKATVGGKTIVKDDLAVLTLFPRRDSETAMVGVIAGTGMAGLKTINLFPYFVSGVHYPDLFVANSSFLRTGERAVEVTGFYGKTWDVKGADLAWQEGDK